MQTILDIRNIYETPSGDEHPIQKSPIEILDFVDLREDRKKLTSQVSGGMQRRLSLAAAMVHEPEVLILDEPSDWDDAIRQSLRIGHESVIGHLRGGVRAWLEAGEPVASGTASVRSDSVWGQMGATSVTSAPAPATSTCAPCGGADARPQRAVHTLDTVRSPRRNGALVGCPGLPFSFLYFGTNCSPTPYVIRTRNNVSLRPSALRMDHPL